MKYAKKYNEINGIEYVVNENEWDFDKAFGWDEQDADKFMNEYIHQVFAEAEPKKDAAEVIKRLKKDGNNIMIITARHNNHVKDVYSVSKNWLEKHDIPYDKLVVNSADKAEKCRENNIDIFIDDSINNCENVLHNLRIPVYLFDSPYNQNYEDTHIKRVFSWKAVYEEMKK